MALQVEHHQTSRFGEWLVVLDDGQLLFRQGKMRLLAPPPAAPPTAPGQDDQSGDRDGCVYWVLSKHCSNQGALGKSGLTSKSLTGTPAVRQNPALCQTPSRQRPACSVRLTASHLEEHCNPIPKPKGILHGHALRFSLSRPSNQTDLEPLESVRCKASD